MAKVTERRVFSSYDFNTVAELVDKCKELCNLPLSEIKLEIEGENYYGSISATYELSWEREETESEERKRILLAAEMQLHQKHRKLVDVMNYLKSRDDADDTIAKLRDEKASITKELVQISKKLTGRS